MNQAISIIDGMNNDSSLTQEKSNEKINIIKTERSLTQDPPTF